MIHNSYKPLFSKYNAINIKNKNNQFNIALLLNKYGALSSIGLESDSVSNLSFIPKMLFDFAVNHPKINLSNSEHYLLCKDINSLQEIHYINATHIKTVVTQTIHPDIKNNVVSFCTANNIDLINLSDENGLLRKSIKLNKIEKFKQLFVILDSLRSVDNPSINPNADKQTVDNYVNYVSDGNYVAYSSCSAYGNYVALFNKNNALMAIGYDGISDVLYHKLKQKQSDFYSFCQSIHDYDTPVLKSLSNLIKTGTVGSMNQPITSLAIQNLVYNVLSDVLGDGYFIQLSSPPNPSDYIGLLSCGIPTKHIKVDLDVNKKDNIEPTLELDEDVENNKIYQTLSTIMNRFNI
jgi:hypothetical protein